MPRITRRTSRETIRIRPRAATALLGAAVLALAFAGCATPGPNHLYVADAAHGDVILDRADTGVATRDVPAFMAGDEKILGLAYDPFTDHLFLRLSPGNRFRVVDRPDRSIKYAFTARGVPATGGGDIAIRSLDRHLFLGDPAAPALMEITLYGDFVQRLPLPDLGGPPGGIAYDQRRELLCILPRDRPRTIALYDRSGRRRGELTLDRPVQGAVLAYDSAAEEFYAREAGDGRIAVFDRSGRRRRVLAGPLPDGALCFDVGPRSFLRLF